MARTQRQATTPPLQIVEQPRGERNETKRERWIRLATSRGSNAIEAMRLLEQLGNRDTYDFTEADRIELIDKLTAQIDRVEQALLHGRKPSSALFDFAAE